MNKNDLIKSLLDFKGDIITEDELNEIVKSLNNKVKYSNSKEDVMLNMLRVRAEESHAFTISIKEEARKCFDIYERDKILDITKSIRKNSIEIDTIIKDTVNNPQDYISSKVQVLLLDIMAGAEVLSITSVIPKVLLEHRYSVSKILVGQIHDIIDSLDRNLDVFADELLKYYDEN